LNLASHLHPKAEVPTQRRVIFIPGLGYDHRIFRNLQLPGIQVDYLDWISPLPEESINAYAKRLYAAISDDSYKTIMVGHSLGGIVSQEIASIYEIDKVILISSIKSRDELPIIFKIMGLLRIARLFTKELSINTVWFWGGAHGFRSAEDKGLFKSMLARQSNMYLQWALRALVSWRPPIIPNHTGVIQVHGTHDKTFPLDLIKDPTYIIDQGSHIAVYKQPQKVGDIIMSEVRKTFE